MNQQDIKFTYKDISIIPSDVSDIRNRSDCSIYRNGDRLPLMTAPMSAVVSLDNFELFRKNGITPVIPRTVDYVDRIQIAQSEFAAFSLTEFKMIVSSDVLEKNREYFICIDIANGHMLHLHELIRKAKESYPNVIIMSGNVATPGGYVALSDAGCDYVRVGIGGGGACITSSNSGIHYPMASLIRDTWIASQSLKKPAQIVADGGIRGFADIIKALTLGADYVMCGTVFNKMLESAGVTYYKKDFRKLIFNQYDEGAKRLFETEALFKEFYGMSTKRAQVEMGNETLKTSEGIEKNQTVDYTMEQWIDNFSHYLRSVMSYVDKTHLDELIGLPDSNFIFISNNSANAINK